MAEDTEEEFAGIARSCLEGLNERYATVDVREQLLPLPVKTISSFSADRSTEGKAG